VRFDVARPKRDSIAVAHDFASLEGENMAIRDEKTGTDEILRDARFHCAALIADPQTSALSEPLKKDIAALKHRRSVHDEKQDARTDALAVLLRTDFDLDERLRIVELEALADAGKNREHAGYRAAFPRGLSTLIALRGEDESRETKVLIGALR
jgi:hypothetical protein